MISRSDQSNFIDSLLKFSDDEYKDYIRDVAQGIFKKVSPVFKKNLGVTEESIASDIQNEKLRLKRHVMNYYENAEPLSVAIDGLFKELNKQFHGNANVI